MRTPLILAAVLTAAVATSQCSKNSSGAGNNNNQTPTGPGPTATTVTVNIVATNGNKSYVPNPVAATTGAMVVFQNNDTTAHRIMMDDGSADLGTLSPGQSSQPRALASGTFHCTIHPSMVGSINGETAPEPPPGSGDGY